MTMETPSPFRNRNTVIFMVCIAAIWVVLVSAHWTGHRLLQPNLESGSEEGAYGSSYTHK